MTRADSLRLMLYFRTDASPRRFALMPASGASIWMSRISCELGRGVQAAPGDVTALSRPRRGFESRWGHHKRRAGGRFPRPVGRAAWIRGLGASDAVIYLKVYQRPAIHMRRCARQARRAMTMLLSEFDDFYLEHRRGKLEDAIEEKEEIC